MDNSHSDVLLGFLKMANTELFARTPRDILNYTSKVTMTLHEGRNTVALPAPYTSYGVGKRLHLRDFDTLGDQVESVECQRGDSSAFHNTNSVGQPSMFATLDDSTLAFDKLADTSYRVILWVTGTHAPFATEMEEVNYPLEFLDFLKYKCASLYMFHRGFGDVGASFTLMAETAFGAIIASAYRDAPFSYSTGEPMQVKMGGIDGYY